MRDMAQNLKLDPKKRDYVVKNGSSVPSSTIEEAAYYALAIPQGKWVYGAPNQGSLLYTLEGIKRTASIEQQFSAYSNDAIKRQLIDTGQASSSSVRNIDATKTSTSNNVEVVPESSTVSQQFNFNSV